MSPLRPDLAACWLFRVVAGSVDILLLRRAAGELYPGVWQCVTGSLEAGERVTEAALREVEEESGLRRVDLEAFFETDIVNWFHAESADGLLCEAVFAARVRPEATVTISEEHDDLRWVTPAEAHELVLWPAYHRAIEQVEWLAANPDKAAAYRLPDPA